MLVLTRKLHQDIVIYDPASPSETMAVVKIVEIRDGNVRLGIKANRNLAVHRREVAEAIGVIHGGSAVGRPGEALPAVTATTLQEGK